MVGLMGRDSVLAGNIHQGGAYTLSIVMVLCLVTGIAIIGLNRSTIDAIRITNNAFAAQEAFNAAEIGLAEAVAIAQPWYFDFDAGVPQLDMQESFTHGSGDTAVTRSYQVTGQFELVGEYIRVHATAAGADAVASVSQLAIMAPLLAIDGFDMPPLVTLGCVDDGSSSPVLCPATDSGRWQSAHYTHAAAVTADNCPDYGGAFNSRFGTGENRILCANGQQPPIAHGFFGIGDGTEDLWSTIFTTNRAWMKQAAAQHPSIEWFGADGATLVTRDDVFGAPDNPMIVIFEGCPLLEGTYYGVVFIEPDPNDPGRGGCLARDWGPVTVYGSLVVNGDFRDWTSLPALHAWATVPGAQLGSLQNGPLQLVPGTWTDTLAPPNPQGAATP